MMLNLIFVLFLFLYKVQLSSMCRLLTIQIESQDYNNKEISFGRISEKPIKLCRDLIHSNTCWTQLSPIPLRQTIMEGQAIVWALLLHIYVTFSMERIECIEDTWDTITLSFTSSELMFDLYYSFRYQIFYIILYTFCNSM